MEALRRLAPRTIDGVLQELIDLGRRADAGEEVFVPRVTLHLRSGRDLTGLALAMASDALGALLVFHALGSDSEHPSDDAVFIPLPAIEAITIHEASRLVEQRSELEPPPSRVALRLQAAEAENTLSSVLGTELEVELAFEGLPESGQPLRRLSELLGLTVHAVRDAARDERRRQALGALRRVVCGGGPKAAIARDGDALVVSGTLASGRDGLPSHDLLRAEIEKLF